MIRSDRAIARAHPKIEDCTHLSTATVRRRDLLLTAAIDIAMAAVTVTALVMVVAIALQPI